MLKIYLHCPKWTAKVRNFSEIQYICASFFAFLQHFSRLAILFIYKIVKIISIGYTESSNRFVISTIATSSTTGKSGTGSPPEGERCNPRQATDRPETGDDNPRQSGRKKNDSRQETPLTRPLAAAPRPRAAPATRAEPGRNLRASLPIPQAARHRAGKPWRRSGKTTQRSRHAQQRLQSQQSLFDMRHTALRLTGSTAETATGHDQTAASRFYAATPPKRRQNKKLLLFLQENPKQTVTKSYGVQFQGDRAQVAAPLAGK